MQEMSVILNYPFPINIFIGTILYNAGVQYPRKNNCIAVGIPCEKKDIELERLWTGHSVGYYSITACMSEPPDVW